MTSYYTDPKGEMIILSPRVVHFWRVWMTVIVVIMIVLAAVAFHFWRLSRHMESKLAAASAALDHCQAELKRHESEPIAAGLSDHMIQYLEEKVEDDIYAQETDAAMVLTDEAADYSDAPIDDDVTGFDVEAEIPADIYASALSKPWNPDMFLPEMPLTRFASIHYFKDAQSLKSRVQFYLMNDPPIASSDPPISGGVVVLCEHHGGWQVYPKQSQPAIARYDAESAARKGYSYRIRRAKQFDVDISPCVAGSPEGRDVQLVLMAIAENGDVVGKTKHVIQY